MTDALGVWGWLIYALIVIVPTAVIYRARQSSDRASTEADKDRAAKQMSNASAMFAVVLLGSFLLVAVMVMFL